MCLRVCHERLVCCNSGRVLVEIYCRECEHCFIFLVYTPAFPVVVGCYLPSRFPYHHAPDALTAMALQRSYRYCACTDGTDSFVMRCH